MDNLMPASYSEGLAAQRPEVHKRRGFAYPCGRFAEGSLLQTERFLQNILEGRFLSAAKECGGGLESRVLERLRPANLACARLPFVRGGCSFKTGLHLGRFGCFQTHA